MRKSVIDYRKRREVKSIGVGDHPQRMRMGKVHVGLLGIKAKKRRKR